MVRIRLTRLGRHKRPFYRIHAVDQRDQRDGKFIENLGWYNPIETDESKRLSVKDDRVKHWLSVGAQASDTCKDIFAKRGLIDADAWKAERASRIERKVKAQKAAAEAAAAEAKAAEEKAAAEQAAKDKAAAEKAAEEAKKAAESAGAEG
ncbi:MAG: 30S ribosomal protein S16 [Phycisphaerales bacterium]